jgi:MerR family transcriptional regulator/heat shock protein HspR
LTGEQQSWPGPVFERIAKPEPGSPDAGEQESPFPGPEMIDGGGAESIDESVKGFVEQIADTVETVELSGVYIISVAARLLEMHPQTLRKYERFGLIRPSRTAGALRLYSDQDLARLRIVRRLVEELGLNLAGVRLLMEVVAQLGLAIQAIERDEVSREARGARTATTHMRAILDFVNA